MSALSGSEIDELRHRDEILQVMYWLLGEGISSAVTTEQLWSFLGREPDPAFTASLEVMADQGWLLRDDSGWALTERGIDVGRRSFDEEFASLTNQAHGECSPDCEFCHGPDAEPELCPAKLGHAAG